MLKRTSATTLRRPSTTRQSFAVTKGASTSRALLADRALPRRLPSKSIANTKTSSKVIAKIETPKSLKTKKKTVRVNYGRLGTIIVSLVILVVIVFKFDALAQTVFGKSSEGDIKAKIAKIVLVQSEVPKIYKIQNPEPLKAKSTFYRDVESGDVVLVYGESEKVLIYRESINKIVNYGSSRDL